MRFFVFFVALSPLLCFADDYQLTEEERLGEGEWLASLGLKMPGDGPLLSRPFAQPFTKRSLLVPKNWWAEPQPDEVTASLMRQDVALLHVVMEKAYGGWDSAARRGWDWGRWFADWDRELAGKGDSRLTLEEALAPFERLERVQLDNHSGPAGKPYFGSGSQTSVLRGSPTGTCTDLKMASGEIFRLNASDPAQVPKAAKIVQGADGPLQDGFYISYPAKRGGAVGIECGGQWITVQTWSGSSRRTAIADLAQKPAGEPSYRAVSETIGYLRLPTFAKANGELLRKLLPTLPESAGHERLLIVDVRGNGGGDAPVREMGRWVDTNRLRPVLNFNRRQPKSCLYDALRWGYAQISSMGLKPPLSDSLRSQLQRELDNLYRGSANGCPVTLEQQRSQWNYSQHVWSAATSRVRPRLMGLTDRGCGSDCEIMVYMLAAVPGSVVVGESTYGVGQFIQPGYFILPHTRVHFRIATGMSDLYGDGRSFDGYGLGPDIVLAGDEAHKPEVILRLAAALAPR